MSFRFTIHGECETPEDERAIVDFLRRALVPLNGEGSPARMLGAAFEGSQAGNVNLLSNPEPVEEAVVVEVPVKPTVAWDTTVPDVLPAPAVSVEDQARIDAAGPDTVFESHTGAWTAPVVPDPSVPTPTVPVEGSPWFPPDPSAPTPTVPVVAPDVPAHVAPDVPAHTVPEANPTGRTA